MIEGAVQNLSDDSIMTQYFCFEMALAQDRGLMFNQTSRNATVIHILFEPGDPFVRVVKINIQKQGFLHQEERIPPKVLSVQCV